MSGRRIATRSAFWGHPAFWLALVAVVAGFQIVRAVRARPPSAPPVLGQAPEFQATTVRNEPISTATLAGKVWVATFLPTACGLKCLARTAQLYQVQHRGRNLGDAFAIVTFGVDPRYDDPATLLGFAEAHRASPRLWKFVHDATPETLRAFDEIAKRAGIANAVEKARAFLLVDGAGQVRGVYDADGPATDSLLRDVGLLVNGVGVK